jgi:hypothetical protein
VEKSRATVGLPSMPRGIWISSIGGDGHVCGVGWPRTLDLGQSPVSRRWKEAAWCCRRSSHGSRCRWSRTRPAPAGRSVPSLHLHFIFSTVEQMGFVDVLYRIPACSSLLSAVLVAYGPMAMPTSAAVAKSGGSRLPGCQLLLIYHEACLLWF